MTKRCKTRNWPLAKFEQSVRATCKRRKLKAIPAAAIKKAYADGLTVRYTVATMGGGK